MDYFEALSGHSPKENEENDEKVKLASRSAESHTRYLQSFTATLSYSISANNRLPISSEMLPFVNHCKVVTRVLSLLRLYFDIRTIIASLL